MFCLQRRTRRRRGLGSTRRARARGRWVRPVPLLPLPGHVQEGGHRVHAVQLRHRPGDEGRAGRQTQGRRRVTRRGA